MPPNDFAMTRFLFAILQQKNLKDIDWNKVAHDPVLAEEISNGHAARMRYSRFKASVLGHEPKPRAKKPRSDKVDDKCRVTKNKKKDDKPTKKEARTRIADSSDTIKQDTGDNASDTQIMVALSTNTSTPAIKPEKASRQSTSFPQPSPQSGTRTLISALAMSQPLPATTTQPSQVLDYQMRPGIRMLTPCSDSDMLGSPQTILASSPTESNPSGPNPAFAYLPTDSAAHCRHDDIDWTTESSALYGGYTSNFDNAYYSMPDAHHHLAHGHNHIHAHDHFRASHEHEKTHLDHEHRPHQTHMVLNNQICDGHPVGPLALMGSREDGHFVKHEHWDPQHRP